MKKYGLIVIGGGPAGIMAAGRAGERGLKVLLLEKMRSPGRKLLITGKGRCNITNNAPISEFIKHVHPNGRFLKHALSLFYNSDIINLLTKQGLEISLERGGRYFPSSSKASDVLDALFSWMKQYSVEVKLNTSVQELLLESDCIKGVRVIRDLGMEDYYADHVILASGGKSYPATGSTGEGYKIATQYGHTLIEARPSLVPLVATESFVEKHHDLRLKNVRASVWINGKKVKDEFGELIITHFGLSGPIILTLSRTVVDALRNRNKVVVSIDLKPALTDKQLDERLLRDLDENGKKQLITVFRLWLPGNLIHVFINSLNLDPSKVCHQLSSLERKNIRKLMKNLPFNIVGNRSFKEAIITAGGICVDEINSKTMESKLVKNLYFAGEVMDLDGDTGGYNLQIAFSTGWLAGESAGRLNS